MLSNAMQEREQQIKYKKTLSSMTKKQDDAFIKSQKAAVEVSVEMRDSLFNKITDVSAYFGSGGDSQLEGYPLPSSKLGSS